MQIQKQVNNNKNITINKIGIAEKWDKFYLKKNFFKQNNIQY